MTPVSLPCVCPSWHWLTHCSEVYWQLAATWNNLPGAYQKRVFSSVRAALGESLRGGPNTAPGVPATTVPTPYDADAMSTYLAEDAESPSAEDDPEAAEARADSPDAAAQAEEDAEAAAAAEAEEVAAAESAAAGGDVGFHSGRAFSLANGHLDQPMPSVSPAVPADGYESDPISVDEVLGSNHESGGMEAGGGACRKVVYHSRRSV
jgi:hypothetical protein